MTERLKRGLRERASSTRRAHLWSSALLALVLALQPLGMRPSSALDSPLPPPAARVPLAAKVMIVSMFANESAPWLAALPMTQSIRIPGLASDYPLVRCTADAVCLMTTGMGHANAAASLMALIYSGALDLQRTYFIIAGVAGIDPARGTIGSAAWARYAVDLGIAHEIDARELPPHWQAGYFGVFTDAPDQKPRLEYRTEVYRLDEALLQKALALSHTAALEDSEDVRTYRAHYPTAPANLPPQVIQCDTASSDTWWAGAHLGEHARRWTRLLTDGHGLYCTTQQEDNATLAALARGAQSGLIDFKRIALLRSGSDFDRPYPGQSALAALRAQLQLAGAGRIAVENLLRAARPLIIDISAHWPSWRDGVPSGRDP